MLIISWIYSPVLIQYNSKKYKEYYKKTKKIYINLKDNIEDKDKKSMKLFYKSRFLYKIYVKLKKVYKERKW